MATARFSDHMCLALRASGLWLRYGSATQNFIPSFPWIVPGWRDQILPSGNLDANQHLRLRRNSSLKSSTHAATTTETMEWREGRQAGRSAAGHASRRPAAALAPAPVRRGWWTVVSIFLVCWQLATASVSLMAM